jgi:hypothetical protein
MTYATAQYRARAERIAAAARERAEFEDIEEKLGALKIDYRRDGTTFRFRNVEALILARKEVPTLNKYRCFASI